MTRMVCVGTGAASSAEAVALARSMRRPGGPAAAEGVELWATVGLHPHDAVDGVDSLDALLAAELGPGPDAGDRVVVAIGECGLDYHYDHSPRPVQRDAFALQIELARRHGLALVVHTREAWDDTVDILAADGRSRADDRPLLHRRSGGGPAVPRPRGVPLLQRRGHLQERRADVREAAALCPMDRLLVETDAPFLTPVPHRGTLNEPSRVPLVGAVIAQVKGITTEEVAAVTTANARAAFARVSPAGLGPGRLDPGSTPAGRFAPRPTSPSVCSAAAHRAVVVVRSRDIGAAPSGRLGGAVPVHPSGVGAVRGTDPRVGTAGRGRKPSQSSPRGEWSPEDRRPTGGPARCRGCSSVGPCSSCRSC